jgi:hypothetical protein
MDESRDKSDDKLDEISFTKKNLTSRLNTINAIGTRKSIHNNTFEDLKTPIFTRHISTPLTVDDNDEEV